ncbi:SEC-C metal-binding domain-containing protein [Tissierella sp.]|uniref:SEC-C metal-binding domain-containing protein n=1 Tax=Tissierella sp. TaxID=41274 RepID=UPI00286D91BC|nr:SEC-C metal-binding domain-containing protein [Tissierella sp.]
MEIGVVKIGRNDSCPCGSGKKYKKCCIDKLSEEIIKQMYIEQLELTKELKDEEICYTVLRIGEEIIVNNQDSVCMTGTYVNMAVAKRVLYYLHQNINDLNDAKTYCTKALDLKPTNQAAIKMMYGICLELKEYQNAYLAIEKYEDVNIFSPMSTQIVMEYQYAVDVANHGEHSETTREWLNKITNALFEKFGMSAGLCGVSIMYYLGIGNDALRAYELGKRCVEDWPNSATYNSLGWVCLSPEINRKDDAITYFLKALELSDEEKQKTEISGNYFIALMETERFEEAEELMRNLIHENPCNQNFSNYAELLKRRGNFEEALEWGKKALFLIEDDTTLLVVADIYKRMANYKDAIEMYKLCLGHINARENVCRFDDVNEYTMYSMASNSSLKMTLYEVLKGIISSFSSQRDYENAKAYLEIAKEKLPKKSDWEIWNQTLPEIEVTEQKHKEIQEQFNEIKKDIDNHKNFVRQWALKLIQLQSNSGQLDLDEEDDWSKYEIEMDKILNEMAQIINKDSIVYKNTESMVNSIYPNLDDASKKFLITAETLYEIHKSSTIDFAPIVVEYCKVVEKQLRVLLANRIPCNVKMLGDVISEIANNRISPYNRYLTDLNKINGLRRKSAHTGVLGKCDADKIRDIFYTNNLLNKLT